MKLACLCRVLGCVLLLAACSGKHGTNQSVVAPRVRGVGNGPAPSNTRPQEEPPRGPAPETPITITPSTDQPAADQAAAAANVVPQRDFPNELLQNMSGAVSCLKPRPAEAAPKQLNVMLTAYVTPSGAVSRGEATCDDLDPDELSCLTKQVAAAHFATPLENAPSSVNATLVINQAPPPPSAAPVPAPPVTPILVPMGAPMPDAPPPAQ